LTTATEVFESAMAKMPSSGIGQWAAEWQAVYEFAESAESENYLGTRCNNSTDPASNRNAS
jgi:hypothetical protein